MPIISRPNLVERTEADIRLEINETEGTIQKLGRAQRRAKSAIRTEGVEVWKTVMDANGQSRRVKRLNPALKRLRECETTIRALQRTLQRLRDELTALELKAKEGVNPMAWLDSENE